ncbi:MAG TPA: inositol monophosphatase family protein [Bryobacteraceae bacterium]
MADLNRIADVLVTAVLAGAREVIATRLAGKVEASYKDEKELVTTADQKSDAAILAVFQERLPAIDPEISFHLEESGITGNRGAKIAGADPIDGTNHFAAGGTLYSVMAHYVEDGIPQIGVIFQPEVYLPLAETENCIGRLVFAMRGQGALSQRSDFRLKKGFALTKPRRIRRTAVPQTRGYVACVPIGSKMDDEGRRRAVSVYNSGIVAASTGAGNAGGNVLLSVFGGQDVYANFGAGEDLDLIPPQVIAIEAGMTVWGMDRKEPVWNVRKQPYIVAPSPEIAERFLQAAGM